MTTNADTALTPPRWNFGDRIRKVRREHHLTQADVARNLNLLDVTAKAVASWETGRTRPRDEVQVARRIEQLGWAPATWMLGLNDPFDGPGTATGSEVQQWDSWTSRHPALASAA